MHEMAGESRGETKRGQHRVDADDAPMGRRHETDLLAQQESETKNDPSINGRAAERPPELLLGHPSTLCNEMLCNGWLLVERQNWGGPFCADVSTFFMLTVP